MMMQVMRRLESPRAVCDCMAALIHGDLAPADGGSSTENAPEQPEEAAVPSPVCTHHKPLALQLCFRLCEPCCHQTQGFELFELPTAAGYNLSRCRALFWSSQWHL